MPSDEEEKIILLRRTDTRTGAPQGRLVAIDNDNDDPKKASNVRELVFTFVVTRLCTNRTGPEKCIFMPEIRP